LVNFRPEYISGFILAIKTFFSKDGKNKIHFWYCSSKAEWPRHKLVDDQVKVSTYISIFPSKNLHLFSKKKEYDNILCKWQMLKEAKEVLTMTSKGNKGGDSPQSCAKEFVGRKKKWEYQKEIKM